MTAKHTRRNIFGLVGFATLLVGFASRANATQPAISKPAVGYQDVPGASGQVCAQCVYYIPLAAGASLGTCKLVAGGIAPGGWCEIWAPKA